MMYKKRTVSREIISFMSTILTKNMISLTIVQICVLGMVGQGVFAEMVSDGAAIEMNTQETYNYAPEYGQQFAPELVRTERENEGYYETDFEQPAYEDAFLEDGKRIERDYRYNFNEDLSMDDIKVDVDVDFKEFSGKNVEIIDPHNGQPIIVYAGDREDRIQHYDPVEHFNLPCNTKSKVVKGKPQAIVHRQAPIVIRRQPTYVKIEHEPVLVRQSPVVFYQNPTTLKQPVVHKHLPQKIQYQPYVVKVEQPIEKKILLEKNKIEKGCGCENEKIIEDDVYTERGYKIKEILPESMHAEIISE